LVALLLGLIRNKFAADGSALGDRCGPKRCRLRGTAADPVSGCAAAKK